MSEFMKNKFVIQYKKETSKRLNEETLRRVTERAEMIFIELTAKYPNVSKAERMHTKRSIFPAIAFYKALVENGCENAMEIMECGSKNRYQKGGDALKKIMRFPGTAGIFMKTAPKMFGKFFGEDAGFRFEFIRNDKKEFAFNMLKCPYKNYCEKEGCPELTHIFCKGDEYTYGGLSTIDFIRTKTLGTGGDMCDFRYVRK